MRKSTFLLILGIVSNSLGIGGFTYYWTPTAGDTVTRNRLKYNYDSIRVWAGRASDTINSKVNPVYYKRGDILIDTLNVTKAIIDTSKTRSARSTRLQADSAFITSNMNIGSATRDSMLTISGGLHVKGGVKLDLPSSGTIDSARAAGTATKLTTARTIGGTSFDGTANIVPDSSRCSRNVTGGNALADSLNIHGTMIQKNGKIGVCSPWATAKIQVNPIDVGGTTNGISVGDTANIDVRIGQSNTRNSIWAWKYNPTVANAYAVFENYGGSNPLCIQSSGGKVGIGNTAPDSTLTVTGSLRASGNAKIGGVLSTTGANALLYCENTTTTGSGLIEVLKTYSSHSSIGDGSKFVFNGSGPTELCRINSIVEAASTVGMALSTFSSSLGERIRITGAGKVGIGNTAPDSTLTVTGSFNTSGNARINGSLLLNGIVKLKNYLSYDGTADKGFSFFSDNRGLFLTTGVVYGDCRITCQFRDDAPLAAGVGGGITFDGIYSSGNAYTVLGAIKGYKSNATDGNSSGQLHFLTKLSGSNPATRMVIDENGNVGIGTTSPTYRLHAYQTGGDCVGLIECGYAYGSTELQLKAVNTRDAQLSFADGDDHQPGAINYSHLSNQMAIRTNGAWRMYIDSVGKIGIGTASPTRKLDVNGTVKANYFITASLDSFAYNDTTFPCTLKTFTLDTVKQTGTVRAIIVGDIVTMSFTGQGTTNPANLYIKINPSICIPSTSTYTACTLNGGNTGSIYAQTDGKFYLKNYDAGTTTGIGACTIKYIK